MTELAFVIPGRLDQLTGGYLYDRHVIDGLRSRGHAVKVIELGPKDHETALAELAEGTTAVIDGLAIPDIEQAVIAEWRRLRLVAVVHHPLAEETGLSRTAAERLVRLEAAALNRFRGVVCPSARTAAAVEAYGIPSDRIFVIPPGTAKPDRASRPRRGPVRSLLCVASVIPRKGHPVLVAALARLRDLDWQMLCIGSLDRDPRTAGLIRQMISAAGLGRRITLAGEQPPRMVMHAYRAADCFVLPSLHEGYGMAFAEAMAYGLPIIATAAGAIPETVPREAGLLVRPGDPAALARALRRVISEQALAVRLVAGSRAAGGRLPDWRQATERWEQALDLPGRRFPLKTETRNAISTHNVALLPVGREMMRVGRKILIVDDDGALRQSLAEQLELHEEFASVQCDSATGALQLASAERFDAILLDVGLPDMDGRELCRLLRRAGVQVPIIMLTGADSDADTVLGLDSGADDYVTKPFRLSVLLARLRAHLRQSEHSDDAVFTIGPYTFRPSAKLLLDASGRKKVRLTDKETAILKYLYRAGDHAIGRDTLLGEVWGYNAGVTTHTLETHVYRLRQKIERDPTRAEILVTEPGGYRLVP